VIGARYDNNNQGSAYVFEKPVGGWGDMTETAKLTASDGADNFQFGCAVAISGDIVVIGARGADGYMGAAYVYVKPVGGWTDMTEAAKLTASDASASKVLGSSVAISGDTIVVGADGDTEKGFKSGAAYVYVKPVGGWTDMTETAKLLASDGAAYDDLGASVAICGDTVTVGANGDDLTYPGQGSAYIFVRPAGGWIDMTETAKLTASDGAASDYFGVSVAIDGDTVVIGAPGVDLTDGTTIYDVGQGYVYVKPVGGWTDMTETAKLSASDGDANSGFGAALGIGADTVVIGAWGDNGYIGAAYIFEKLEVIWTDMTEIAKLTASDGAAGDDFGYSVNIGQGTVVSGAHLDDDSGNSSGSAYIFMSTITCGGEEATIIGTEDDDLIMGTDGNDVIVGLGGNDIIYGLGGKDIICGGDGDDILYGGNRRDVLFGENGNDVLRGEGGPDRLKGGNGNDTLDGGRKNDLLRGGNGNDTLAGGDGDDDLRGDDGVDVCDGGNQDIADSADATCECTVDIE
jgi:Ca2+-binding RTX toxin-like protein